MQVYGSAFRRLCVFASNASVDVNFVLINVRRCGKMEVVGNIE